MQKRATAIIIFLPIIALWILAWGLTIMGSTQTTNQAAAFLERTESIIRTVFLKH